MWEKQKNKERQIQDKKTLEKKRLQQRKKTTHPKLSINKELDAWQKRNYPKGSLPPAKGLGANLILVARPKGEPVPGRAPMPARPTGRPWHVKTRGVVRHDYVIPAQQRYADWFDLYHQSAQGSIRWLNTRFRALYVTERRAEASLNPMLTERIFHESAALRETFPKVYGVANPGAYAMSEFGQDFATRADREVDAMADFPGEAAALSLAALKHRAGENAAQAASASASYGG